MSDNILDWLKMWAEYPSVKAAYGDKISRAANEIERLRTENEKLRANFTVLADAVRAAKEAASYNRHKNEHCISRSMWSALSDQEKYARKALSGIAALKETGDE